MVAHGIEGGMVSSALSLYLSLSPPPPPLVLHGVLGWRSWEAHFLGITSDPKNRVVTVTGCHYTKYSPLPPGNRDHPSPPGNRCNRSTGYNPHAELVTPSSGGHWGSQALSELIWPSQTLETASLSLRFWYKFGDFWGKNDQPTDSQLLALHRSDAVGFTRSLHRSDVISPPQTTSQTDECRARR